MPVEGQWQRANTPLSRRDKRLLGALAVLAAAGAAALGIAFATHTSSSGAGCVTVDVPSTMGGARLHNCGNAAHRFCRTQGPRDARIAAACRKQGFAADVAAGR
jgi:hypothetical protein